MSGMADPGTYVDEIRRIISFALEIPPERLADTTPFDDIGLTSRQRIQLLSRVEVTYGVSVDIDELDRLVDIRGVAEVIAEAVTAQRPRE
jgi:acyl carrier protein